MELYHVLNRGVDKRIIFLDNQDYARFVHNLYASNDSSPMRHTGRMVGIGCRDRRERLVDIHGWCLMNNHFHLILTPCVERGISRFMQKVNIGYVKYFNEKYKRPGTLFQGKTKKVPIENEAHFYHILHYVHLNPLDYLKGATEWRERTVEDADAAIAYLKKYRWSSYLDYCGVKNFPSVISRDLFGEVFGDYEKELLSYLKSMTI
ncbi:transposase [Candidatus Uhrbacteria bacterium]|nr:transposase [Candidatus Uhrbacteria bacterium]